MIKLNDIEKAVLQLRNEGFKRVRVSIWSHEKYRCLIQAIEFSLQEDNSNILKSGKLSKHISKHLVDYLEQGTEFSVHQID